MTSQSITETGCSKDSALKIPAFGELALYGFVLTLYFIVAHLIGNEVNVNRWMRYLPALFILGFAGIWKHIRPEAGEFLKLRGGLRKAKFFAIPELLSIIVVIYATFASNSWAIGYASYQRDALYLIVFVPLFEEVFFRGLLLKHCLDQFSPPAAVIMTSLLFAFLHFPQGIFIQMFIFSIIFGWATVKCGSIHFALVGHIALNASSEIRSMFDEPLRLSWMILAIGVIIILVINGISKTKTRCESP